MMKLWLEPPGGGRQIDPEVLKMLIGRGAARKMNEVTGRIRRQQWF